MKENNIAPEDFQGLLTQAGGVNVFDEPNFLVVWGQGGDYECTYRAGGAWSVDEQYFLGYRDLLKTSGEPCWSLLQWHDPLEYGTPESYYATNYDEGSGLQILGEYPYSGRYEILFNMRYRELVPGEGIKFEYMPLSSYLLDIVVPILLDAQGISAEKKQAAYMDMREREEREKLSAVEQRIREAELPFKDNPVSYTRQGARTPAIDRKVIEMSRNWDKISRSARQLRTGPQTGEIK